MLRIETRRMRDFHPPLNSGLDEPTLRYVRFKKLFAVLIAPTIGCAAYAQTTYQDWRAKNPYFAGGGGTVQNRDGIDVWTSGTPDRPFEVLGVINAAQTNDFNAIAIVARANQDTKIIKLAKEHGGDALVWLSADTQVTGYTTSGSAYAHSFGNSAYARGSAKTRANTVSSGVLAVVRYLSQAEIQRVTGGASSQAQSPPAPERQGPIQTTIWDVAIIANGETRMLAAMQLNHQGNQVGGRFVLQDGTTGELGGIIQGGVFEFQVQQPPPCQGQFRGQAAIQNDGSLLAGTYVGQASCTGQVSAEFRAVLRTE